MNWKILFAYSITILLWGSAFLAIKFGLQSYSPEHLAALRLFIGAIGLIVFAAVRKIRLPDIKDVPVILLLGFLGFTVYHTALSFGENSVSAGESSLIVSTTPIFSAILATLFLKERFPKIGWLGSITAFLGVAMISFGKDDSLTMLPLGALWILTAALGESFYFVFQSKYLKKYGFFPFTIYTIIAGTVCMLFFLPGLAGEVLSASPSSTYAVLYLGLFPTLIPYFALAYITSKVGPSEATSSLYLTPAIALIISWVWLGEIPALLSLAGGTLTLIGVSLLSLKVNNVQDMTTDRDRRQSYTDL